LVELLLKNSANPNASDVEGFNSLNQAVVEGHFDIAERLIAHGASINHRYKGDGYSTVLHTAASYGFDDCVRFLLHHGGDVTVMDDVGKTPYDYAIFYRHLNTAKILKPEIQVEQDAAANP